MAIIAAFGTGAVVPLTARPWWRGLVGLVEVIGAIGRGRHFRFASEELILELAILAAELGDFLFQRGDLLFDHGMLTAPVAGLLPQFEILASQLRHFGRNSVTSCRRCASQGGSVAETG